MNDETKSELEQAAEAAKAEAKHPTDAELLKYLRAGTHSIRQLCDEFNLPPGKMSDRLDEFEASGYVFMRSNDAVSAVKFVRPRVATPAKTLADGPGTWISIGWVSDMHAGDRHSQPSGILSVARIMYEEYGVRHFCQPGDITAGVYIYRGQEEDLLLEARPWARHSAWRATQNQVWLADQYIPRLDGATWHTLGGNHDWSHVVHSGVDPVRLLADNRDDMEYLGYDSAGLWLTDKVYVRMWHPRGGLPYAKSYRLQKGLETLAVEALQAAIAREENPVTSLLVAGHLHIVLWMPELPMAGMHPGCFQGKTNLGRQLGLNPALGGVVTKFMIADNGKVKRIEFSWLPVEEIEDDWKNFPVPPTDLDYFDSEHVGPLLEGPKTEDGEGPDGDDGGQPFPEEDGPERLDPGPFNIDLPASGNPYGEYTGGH